METARKSLVGKARARPDQVKQVVEKARRDGLSRDDPGGALAARASRPRSAIRRPASSSPSATGLAISSRATASPAAAATTPSTPRSTAFRRTSACRVPEGLDFAQAAFATVGSIALHGVRQADVRLGERVAVIGLGLVGQLAAQILRAAGCTVVGVDLSPELVELARRLGAHEAFVRAEVPERGDCDAVVISRGDGLLRPGRARRRAVPRPRPGGGRRRRRDGGPARRLLREGARPACLALVRAGPLRPRVRGARPRLSDRLRPLDRAAQHERVSRPRRLEAGRRRVARSPSASPSSRRPRPTNGCVGAERSPLGIVLEYDPGPEPGPPPPRRIRYVEAVARRASGVIGAGSFATRILIPGLQRAGFQLRSVASSSGLSARAAADRFGCAARCSRPSSSADPDVGLVAIATRHDSHAALAAEALRAGKAVFVEKPPALNDGRARRRCAPRGRSRSAPLAVGFNRRFAPLAGELRAAIWRTETVRARLPRQRRSTARRPLARRPRRRRRAPARRGLPLRRLRMLVRRRPP